MILQKQQARAADLLRSAKPAVIPGTCVILSEADRKDWYDRVKAFCDRAGVPD